MRDPKTRACQFTISAIPDFKFVAFIMLLVATLVQPRTAGVCWWRRRLVGTRVLRQLSTNLFFELPQFSLFPNSPITTMSKFGTIIMGPAGAGKTTFCSALIQNLRNNRRSVFYINLDPAADDFAYEPDVDIKELISLDDAMEELQLGPNGGLIACFEYLLNNIDFLTEPLESVTEEELIIIDMPGQIELYTHVPLVPRLVERLSGGELNIRFCAAYLLESTFVIDKAKFFAGTLSAMSAMLMMGLPHVNILSKMDLVRNTMAKRELKKFFNPEAELLDDDETTASRMRFENASDDEEQVPGDSMASGTIMKGKSYQKLNEAVAGLIDTYGLVSFLQLDAQDEDSVGAVLSYIDDAIQFHEAQEPKEPKDEEYDQFIDEEMEQDD
jgi:GTPase SAR1 family protein